MSHLNNLSPIIAILVAVLVVLGSSLALLGSLGLVRLRSFYQRLHAPTLSYSYGALLIIIGSMMMFSLLEERLVVHELVIGIFMLITTPISLLMLGRAGLRRDRDAKLGHDEIVPPRISPGAGIEIPARDLSEYGEGMMDRRILSRSAKVEGQTDISTDEPGGSD
ncbi:monovalent cation/H(+) antiporter subunit G [Paracoccus sp. MBLB3053]|uniref:Monovalent cation/H(+) antiporter subunit G n=1 Tax=Paracoccus aurantius TaxID=3073814 RepID=A0ABU2HVI9_9RHOB|nr:monovalent cation/H(+) antiporter subunit G [Paracoccus sp. MBLB3053]MDS9468304.1 monovalent cation/H(+) antiporter subunit G [Paracoccus sp. MBLB3053]